MLIFLSLTGTSKVGQKAASNVAKATSKCTFPQYLKAVVDIDTQRPHKDSFYHSCVQIPAGGEVLPLGAGCEVSFRGIGDDDKKFVVLGFKHVKGSTVGNCTVFAAPVGYKDFKNVLALRMGLKDIIFYSMDASWNEKYAEQLFGSFFLTQQNV